MYRHGSATGVIPRPSGLSQSPGLSSKTFSTFPLAIRLHVSVHVSHATLSFHLTLSFQQGNSYSISKGSGRNYKGLIIILKGDT